MPKNGVDWDEDMWVEMIGSYGKADMVEKSVKLFQKMGALGMERTIKPHNMLFKVIMRRGRYMMVVRGDEGLGIKPDATTHSTLLPGLCEAQTSLKEMVEKHIEPKENSIFMRLITEHCKAGNLDAAADVLEAMIRLSIPIEAELLHGRIV
ncbi:hypothetical protein LIER_11154 [Lithospermum erythrorhizon]|uniref:Pentatricopeptide repeat-containing protein n=1 Tax=Lithospermum erythrorhizon TaxID=34254 RepID=A0AAV3PLY1_LITER